MKRFLLSSMLMLIVTCAFSADYYWVGGAGNWTDINHWASVSGGVANKSIVPGTGDDVYFDANSGLTNDAQVVLPVSVHAFGRNISFAGVTVNAIFRNGSNGAFGLQVYGNLEFSASSRFALTNIFFVGSGNATFKTNAALRYGGINGYNHFTVNKPGGSLKVLDGIITNTGIGAIDLKEGTLDMSGNTHQINRLLSQNNNTRTLNITNATIEAAVEYKVDAINATLLSTGSGIVTAYWVSNGLSYNKVEITGTAGDIMITNTTFSELTFSNPAAIAGSVRVQSGNTIGRLEFKGGGRIQEGGTVIGKLILAPAKGYIFREPITVTELFQFNTPDCNALGQITGGPAIDLNLAPGAVADVRNVFLTNMKISGAITPISVLGYDGGGNTGFDIQPRPSGSTLYWVGGGGDWNDKAHWSFTSGGTGGDCVPFTGDDVIFDANSGFTTSSKTVSITGNAWCHNLSWTNVANSPIFNVGAAFLEVRGNIELDPTLTTNGNITTRGTEASTFLSKGASLGTAQIVVNKTLPTGAITVLDDLNYPNLTFAVTSGKLLMPNRTMNFAELNSNVNTTRTLDLSNSTLTLKGMVFSGNNLTSPNNAAGSFITTSGRTALTAFTLPKVHVGSAVDDVQFINCTLAEVVFTNASPSSAIWPFRGGNDVASVEFKSGAVFSNNNTFGNVKFAPSRTYKFYTGIQTINGQFTFNSPACNGLGELRAMPGAITPTLNFGPSSSMNFSNAYVREMTAAGKGVPISLAGADAGGNTGFVFTSSVSGARYWVGGAGDWNDGAHWSTSSGGTGGACVPTVDNDVYFDANSFTAGSNIVTISQGQAYCRNMDWSGANNAPVFNKSASFLLEVWGNLVLNPVVTMNAHLTLTGNINSSISPNGSTLGNLDFNILKNDGNSVTFMQDFTNAQTGIEMRSGTLDMSNRTITISGFSDYAFATPHTVIMTNANVTAFWEATGPGLTLQAAGSTLTTTTTTNITGGTYNKVMVTGITAAQININNANITSLTFSNTAANSGARITSGNNIATLEFKGRGSVIGNNTIGDLILSPGKTYTLNQNTNNTITGNLYASGTPCNLTQISTTGGTATLSKTTGKAELDYVRLQGIVASGVTPFKALEHSEDLGGNAGWSFAPYNNATPILGLGPDKTLCAGEFPYTINTEGFFASPMATYTWGDGSTNPTLAVAAPGTYTVTVSYPDGCSRSDEIVITESIVTVAAVTGTANVCTAATTSLSSTTPGGVWSSSDAAVATVSATGVVTGVAAGSADIIYTVTNGNGCSASQQLAVTVNAMPTVAATTGPATVFAGDNMTLSNATVGGVWSSSNTAVATVSNIGVVTGVTAGTADIIYTVTGTGGCAVASTVTITVDAFDPAKRVLSITKTADAAEPATDGSFSIGLPAGVNAVEDITVSYAVTGTAAAPSDYAALSGTAVILAGQNAVAIPVNIVNDTQIESTETVIATLTAGTSINYTYTIDGAAANATVQITDDDDVPANRLLSVTAQLNANEPTNTGTFTIALPAGVLAPENITVAYTMSGTAGNGVDYETLSGTATLPAGQNSVVIDVKAIDDQIIEQTKNIILTVTGGTTTAAGSFGVDAINGVATLLQADNDYTAATRLLAVSGNGDAAEPGTNSSFTIRLPAGYVSSLPITVDYTLTGTAAYGVDYSSTSATSITLPAGQNSITVPVNVINDDLIERSETVKLTVTGGVASQSGSTVFTLTADPASPNATINLTDEDNTPANRTLTVTAQSDAAEPATNGSFKVSLPAGLLASEDISVSYAVGSGTATPGTDYTAITGSIIIPAGQNSVLVPVKVIDNSIIESTETVILNVTGGTSANFSYTAATINSATVNITDNDAATSSTLVLLTKVSDAIEGGTNGQYRISLPPGVTSAEDISVSFSVAGSATRPADYTLLGLSGGNIVIPAGANGVLIDVDAINDGEIEGPETVTLSLTSATSVSLPYAIDPSGNGAVVSIVDANAASSTPLQVITGTNAAEPSGNATFTVKLAGVATSAWPVTVGYQVSGTATSGLDYEGMGEIIIPAGQNSVAVTLNVKDDQIIEQTETMVFTILSGSATDGGGNAFIFPPDPANNDITVNITDNDANAGNQVLKVVKTTDAAEPNTNGGFTVSLPPGYTSSANLTLNYNMAGNATRNTDYTISTITLPANQNSVSLPLSVTNDQIIEGTETATLNLIGGTDGNSFTYSADPASSAATLNITDDDNTALNRMLSAVAVSDAAEGGAAGSFTIKLPDNITAANNVTVNYTIAGTATSGVDYTALTGTATITAGQNSVPVTVTPVNDDVIELTETVTLTITGGTGGGENFTPATGSETASVNITDDDNTLANRTLRIVRTAHAAESGANGVFSIQLTTNVNRKSSEDITVNYTVAGTATPGVDYTTLSGSVVLPAGQNSVPLNVQTINDQIIENAETVIVTLVDGNSASFNFPVNATAASLSIADDDNIPANRVLTLTKTADAAEPGTNGNVRLSLPPNITCNCTINVTYNHNGSTANLPNATVPDFMNPGVMRIMPGQNYVDLPVRVINDNLMENTETVVFNYGYAMGISGLNPPQTFTYSSTTPVTVNIGDDDNTPANRTLSVTKERDATEGGIGTNGSIRFNFSLPASVSASENLTVNYTVSGTGLLNTDYTPLSGSDFSGTATILPGTSSTAIVATAVDDQIIEGTEDVVITVNSVTSPNFTYTIDPAASNATGYIYDNDNLPANLELSVAKTADAVESGAHGEFTISLPGTTTATEDITVNYTIAGTATNGTDYTSLNGTVIIPAGDHEVKVPVIASADQLIESAETVELTITGGTSASFAFTASTSNNKATVNITDADNTPVNLNLTITKLNDASEPGVSGRVSITLPTGITATQDITVNYTVSGTATADVDYAALPGTATLLAGRNSVTIPVAVIDDQLIELSETVVITLTGGSNTGNVYTGTGTVTVNISDDESTQANLALSISKGADAAEPGTPGSFIIALPENITATEDITVNYTISGTATAGIDYDALGSVLIPAGSNSISVPLNVIDDQAIESVETVVFSLTGGSSSSFTFTGTGSAALDIVDDDNIPENLVLGIQKITDAAEPLTSGGFRFNLPAGVTVAEDITVNYTISGTATAGSDYATLSGTVTIPADQNSVDVAVNVLNDNIIEPTETVTASLTGGSSTSFAFTGEGIATVNINDDESTIPANLVLGISKGTDGAESGSNASFIISLPAGLTATADINVNYTVSGTATSGADYTALPGSVVIPAGQNSVAVPVTVINDEIIEAIETLTLTLAGGSSGNLTFTGTGSATANIADDDSSPQNLTLGIVKTADAAEPSTNGSFSIGLPAGVVAAEDITVNYTISGTATAGTDYTALSGSVLIPAGQNAVTIPLVVADDNVPETTETLTLTLTGGTSASFTFTASGTGATATANITDDDKRDQVITFNALPVKTFGDPAFSLNATGGASGNPVSYTSSDPSVATVSGNTVTIVSAGTATITASQAGNAGYHAAADVTRVLTVMPKPNTAPTLAAIGDQQLCYTTAMQTLALTGITAGTEQDQTFTLNVSSSNPDLFSALNVTPLSNGNASLNYTVKNNSTGTAVITVTVKDNGGTLNGGSDTFSRTFTLVVSALPQLQIAADPGTSVSKGQTIALSASGAASYSWANASGIISGQNSAILTVRPAQTTTYTVTGTSAAGCTSTQTITITVIEDYNLVANNVLTPNGDGKNDFFVIQNIDMYPNNEVRVFDRAGRAIYSKRGYTNDWDGTINGTPLHEETYYYIIDLGKGVKPKRGFISIVRKY